jgi:iron complex transport system substrate-binding protein
MIERLGLVLLLLASLFLNGCRHHGIRDEQMITVQDQLGRMVQLPRHLDRIAALHHFGGKIIYALRQEDKLVEQALYGIEAKTMAAVDPKFAALPLTLEGHSINLEHLVALKPQCVFVYASFDRSEMEQLENAGIRVFAVRGETLEESFQAIKLVAKVLDCEAKGQAYLDDCRRLLELVQDRTRDVPPAKRPRVMFTGPKSIYTLATGEMLQSEMIERAGALNIAASLKGFWSDVSPEQVAVWNPDVIFLGSSLATYGSSEIYTNPQFRTVKAVKDKKVFVFPSNIGWWDYPAPHCVLGVVWSAKTLYPERFKDIDMSRIADEFYVKYMGHTFSAMGGKL